MSAFMGHDRTKKTVAPDEDEVDPIDNMINKTGCAQHHYDIQMCMADHQDWRKCQAEVQAFRKCIEDYQKKVSQGKT